MFEGLFGSILAKAVWSVAAAFGLFGGLAVVGVLPVLGDNASDTVVIDALAVVETEEDVVALNPFVELPSVDGVASQVPVVDDLTSSLPPVDGITGSGNAVDSGLPLLGLVGTLLNSLTGTVDAVMASLPVVNRAVPGLPVAGGVEIPSSSASAPGVDLIDGTLGGVPGTVSSALNVPVVGDLSSVTRDLPLVDDLLRTAQVALYGLVPDLVLIVD